MPQTSNMFLKTVITLAYCISAALSYNCYQCQDFEFENEFYDPECDKDQYSGNTITCDDGASCFTDVYQDGRLRRGCDINWDEVQCVHHNFPHSTQCFCEGDLCNKGICSECITGSSTLSTIKTSTPDVSTSTAEITTSTPEVSTSTPDVSTPTTEITTSTPEVSTSTSDDSTSTTEINTSTPEVSTATPDVSTSTREITTSTTEVSTSTPDVSTSTPDVTTPTPGISTTTPDLSTTTLDVSTTTADISTSTPVFTTPTADVSTTTPDLSTTTTEVFTTTPEVSTSTPDVSTSTQETTTRTPVESIVCYDCQSTNPNGIAYDETCEELGYDGPTYACDNCGSCFTEVHDDGVIRGEAGAFTNECAYGQDYVACYCTKDLCNNHLCEQC